jgi:hypothetical protein
MDRNGDGSVDKKELFSWILRSFRSLSQEESSDRFQDTDDDQVYKKFLNLPLQRYRCM